MGDQINNQSVNFNWRSYFGQKNIFHEDHGRYLHYLLNVPLLLNLKTLTFKSTKPECVNKLRLIIMIKYVHNKIFNNNVMSLRRLRVNVRKNQGKNTPSKLHVEVKYERAGKVVFLMLILVWYQLLTYIMPL